MKFKQGTLDLSRGVGGRAFRFRTGVLCAAAMSVALFCVFGYVVIKLGDGEILARQPMVPMLFPVVGALLFALMLPLFVFIVYSEDFSGLNPILPHHYFFIAKKTFKAFETGNWKISAKDL